MAKSKKTKTAPTKPTQHDPDLLDDGIVDDDYQPSDGTATRVAVSDADADTETVRHAEADDDDDAPDSEPASAPSAPTPDRAYVDPRDEPRRTRYLKHFLTSGEIVAMRLEREEGDAEYERFDEELTAAQVRARSLKTKMEAIAIRGRELSKTIREGWEMRDIECIEERGTDTDPASKTFGKLGMRTIRVDTGECIEWREFNRSERQGQLFDDPAPAPSVTAPPAASAQA